MDTSVLTTSGNHTDAAQLLDLALTGGEAGNAFAQRGDFASAIPQYEHALDLALRASAPILVARTLGNLGAVYAASHRYDRAIESYNQALGVFRLIEDVEGEITHLGNLAAAYAGAGNLARAKEVAEQALALLGRENGQPQESRIRSVLGLILLRQKNYSEAIAQFQQALAVADKSLDRPEVLANLSHAYLGAGQTDAAREAAQQAVNSARAARDKHGEVQALSVLGSM